MGLLVDGQWQDKWYDTKSSDGHFIRKESQFRNWVTADGSAGPSGEGGFKAEAGRYHLYVSYACPWAHRTLIVRSLKGLEDLISVSVVSPIMLEQGWTFKTDEGSTGDALFEYDYLHQVYTRAEPHYSGRVTVPVLWDQHQDRPVNNESSEIIRMLNTAFDDIGAKPGDFYPPALQSEIDALNERVYGAVNNGVYKAGFATTQDAYESAVYPLFETLDWLEEKLSAQRYLVGNQLTEADIRLFVTLLRFDPVYYSHFKTNIRQLRDYAALWGFTRDIYQLAGVAETVNMQHIKVHYYHSQRAVNPTGVTPVGGVYDLAAPHGRDRLGPAYLAA